MDKEREAISTIHKALGSEMKDIFNTDAQAFNIGIKNFLFTIDEYSGEDYFRDDKPYNLGWNLVMATLSDILAAGGTPLFYGHSMTIPAHWDQAYLLEFCKGIKHCLQKAGVSFIGGDTGFADTWKYTGIAIGEQFTALKRSGARAGDFIYMTGKVGAGNLEAAIKMFANNPSLNTRLGNLEITFPCRIREAEIIRKYASSCTDSSDGMLKALINVAESSKLGFLAENIPYMDEAVVACNSLNIDKVLLFMGECGEYELVFTIPVEEEESFLNDVRTGGLSIARIGKMNDSKEYLLDEKQQLINFQGYSLHARNYDEIKDYLSAISEFIKHSQT